MHIAVGLIIGAVTGALQIFLLGKFVKAITSSGEGAPRALPLGFAQLLLPFIVLLAVAFIYREALLWAGLGAGTALIILAFVKALLGRRGK